MTTANDASSAKLSVGPAAQFSIGAEALCADGSCGNLIWVAIDPVSGVLTHVVVEPKHRVGLGRLVPVDLVVKAGEQVTLSCTMAQFEHLESAEETRFLPGGDGVLGYTPDQTRAWPYYGLGMGLGSIGGMGSMATMGVGNAPQPIIYDNVPLGEVQVRRGDRVHASDGEIGSVQGLVIEPTGHHVTHVLLAEGHLWGRKQVAIPIRLVTIVNAGISVSLTKAQIQDLEAVELTTTA